MPQYDIAFAEKLSEIAKFVLADGVDESEAKRAVLYLSLLSTELSLKSMLEKAGTPIKQIRNRSHDIAGLLKDLGECEVLAEIAPGKFSVAAASRLRAKTFHYGEELATLGEIIDSRPGKTSKYPNDVRYGEQLRHYPPGVVVQVASTVVSFAREHWDSLRPKSI